MRYGRVKIENIRGGILGMEVGVKSLHEGRFALYFNEGC